MDNVQCFTLSSIVGKQPIYALAIISAKHVNGSTGLITYMVDKVRTIPAQDVPAYRSTLSKLSRISTGMLGTEAAETKRTFDPITPLTAKKARRLGESPTDASL